MSLQSTVGRAIEELYNHLFLKIEEIALEYAFLVPVIFHKIIIDMWDFFKLFIHDCLEILDFFFVRISQETQLHHPDLHSTVGPIIINTTEVTRRNAYALDARREKIVNVLLTFFRMWQEAVSNVEKDIIHPTATLATKTAKRYYVRVVEISEPAIAITQPVWNPIAEKVIDLNDSLVYSPIIGPFVGKVEAMVTGAVDSVVAYCNDTEVPSQ